MKPSRSASLTLAVSSMLPFGGMMPSTRPENVSMKAETIDTKEARFAAMLKRARRRERNKRNWAAERHEIGGSK